MKKIKLYLSAVITAGLMLFTACEKDAVDPLSGKYPAPENYALATLLSQDAEKGATTRVFTLEFGDANRHLSVQFVGARLSYFLAPGNYTIADQSVAKAGNYIAGYDNGGTYWVNGGSRLKLTDGTIAVQLDGDTYTISGTVILEDRSIIKIAYTGIITFEPDPVPLTYTLETETPASGGGWPPASIDNSRMNKITVYADGEQVAYFEVVTADGATSLSGSYVVIDGLNATGQAANGYYIDMSWYSGSGIMEGGCHYLDNGEKMFIRAGGGNIVITDNNGTLAITGSNLSILDVPALAASNGTSWVNLSTPGSMNYQNVTREVVQTLTYTLETSKPAMGGMMGNEPITGSQLNKITVLADGEQVAYFELVSAENPASLAGSYVVTDGLSATGQAANGYQLPAAWGGLSGGCYYIVNSEKMFIRAGGGDIVITDNAGVLTITGSNLPILDVAAVESSGGTNWANLPDAGSISFANVTKITP